MNAIERWATVVNWLIFAAFTGWLIYLISLNYGSCRADGSGKLGCFALALFVSWFEMLITIAVLIGRLLMFILR